MEIFFFREDLLMPEPGFKPGHGLVPFHLGRQNLFKPMTHRQADVTKRLEWT